MNKRIPVAVPNFIGNEKKYVNDCLESTWISSIGKYINLFEENFADFIGAKHAISCCNGTVALHLALLALGIKETDEVIVPSLTYIATANSVSYCGATVVLADCERDTWNIDPEDIRRKITPKTKAIIVVHLYGNMCNMDEIMKIAKEHDIFVIEDAAECHGAEYSGKKAGSIGDIGVFSLFGNKIITTGEGGIITTNNEDFALKMRLLRGQGMSQDRRYWFPIIGYNYRMTNIEAAIGLAQLENIKEHINRRYKVADLYKKFLKPLIDDGYIEIQKETYDSKMVYWMFSILLTDKTKVNRDELIELLDREGVETRPLFYPLHIMPPYFNESCNCKISEDIASRGLNLPTHELMTEQDCTYICMLISKFVKGKQS